VALIIGYLIEVFPIIIYTPKIMSEGR